MAIILFVALLLSQAVSSAPVNRTTTTEQPDLIISDSIDELEKPLGRVSPFFEVDYDRTEAVKILHRAIDMIMHRPAPSRGPSFDDEAKYILRGLTNQQTIGSTSEESKSNSPIKKKKKIDPDYCVITTPSGAKRNITMNTREIILDQVDNKNYSEDTVKGKYPWYNRQYLPSMRSCVANGGERLSRFRQINDRVLERVTEERAAGNEVHDFQIVKWALQHADEIGARSFFKASKRWLEDFKKRNGIVSRKITKYVSKAQARREETLEETINAFRDRYLSASFRFPPRLIFNMDQTGFNYEIYRDRTLSFKSDRDTVVRVNNQNKRTHSYTAQPMITRDGRTFGKLLLCLQERGGSFGPRIEPVVRDLERRYTNIRVVASNSGKMTSNLTRDWIRSVLLPALATRLNSLDTETEIDSLSGSMDSLSTYDQDEEVFEALDEGAIRDCSNDVRARGEPICHAVPPAANCNYLPICLAPNPSDKCRARLERLAQKRCASRPHSLILLDSWGGHGSDLMQAELLAHGIEVLTIPPGATGKIQPLDVTFMRQYKKFLKLILQESILTGDIDRVTSRDGLINMHSLVWNQFGSYAYTDMLRYAWRHTDPAYTDAEIQNEPRPMLVNDIQFKFDPAAKCSVSNCSEHAFIKCSHCGKLLCLKHFMDRVCFHDTDGPVAGSSRDPQPSGSRQELAPLGPVRQMPSMQIYDDWEQNMALLMAEEQDLYGSYLPTESTTRHGSTPRPDEELRA